MGEEKAFFAERNWVFAAKGRRNGRAKAKKKRFLRNENIARRAWGHRVADENGWPKTHDWRGRETYKIQLSNNCGPTL